METVLTEIKELLSSSAAQLDHERTPAADASAPEGSSAGCPIPGTSQEVGHASSTREEILEALMSSDDDEMSASKEDQRPSVPGGGSRNDDGDDSGLTEPNASAAPYPGITAPLETNAPGTFFPLSCKNYLLYESICFRTPTGRC